MPNRDQECAFGGSGGGRLRKGAKNECLANKHGKKSPSWRKKATVIEKIGGQLTAAGFGEALIEEASAEVLVQRVPESGYVCINCTNVFGEG